MRYKDKIISNYLQHFEVTRMEVCPYGFPRYDHLIGHCDNISDAIIGNASDHSLNNSENEGLFVNY